ncbi:MAG: hypothetical protein ACREEW_14390 [Caulobacteraceae bacterium]
MNPLGFGQAGFRRVRNPSILLVKSMIVQIERRRYARPQPLTLIFERNRWFVRFTLRALGLRSVKREIMAVWYSERGL